MDDKWKKSVDRLELSSIKSLLRTPSLISSLGILMSKVRLFGIFYCEGSSNLTEFTCKVSGLPDGLAQGTCTLMVEEALQRLTCPVSGTPVVAGSVTLFYTATASNAIGQGSNTSTLTINPPFNGCTPELGAYKLESVRPGDERLRQIRELANGIYYIELIGEPGWRTGPTTDNSSYIRQEGMNPAQLDREISVSRCIGDTTLDDETLEVHSGEASSYGAYLFFYALPPNATPVRAGPSPFNTNGLPGLNDGTTWYLNIRQTRCENPPGTPWDKCALVYDVIP